MIFFGVPSVSQQLLSQIIIAYFFLSSFPEGKSLIAVFFEHHRISPGRIKRLFHLGTCPLLGPHGQMRTALIAVWAQAAGEKWYSCPQKAQALWSFHSDSGTDSNLVCFSLSFCTWLPVALMRMEVGGSPPFRVFSVLYVGLIQARQLLTIENVL